MLFRSTCVLVASVVDLAGQEATSTTVTVQIDRTPPVLVGLASPAVPLGAPIQLVAIDDFDADPTNGMQVNLTLYASGLAVGNKVQFDAFDDTGKKTASAVCTVTAAIADSQKGKIFCGLQTLPDGYKVKLQFSTADDAGNPGVLTVNGQEIGRAHV